MSHHLNFLQETEPAPLPARRSRKRLFVYVVLAVSLCIGIWATIVLVATGRVAASALDGRDALYRARDAASVLDFEKALSELHAADAYLSEAERGMVVLRTAEFVPWVGSQIQAADALVGSSREIVDAIDDIVVIGADLLRLTGLTEEDLQAMSEGLEPSLTFDDLSADTKRSILTRLYASADDLELTEAKIRIALSELDAVREDEVVTPVLEALEPIREKLEEAAGVVHTLSIGARLLPELAGLGEERTHLILFLNNTELRPGGGFIGTYGVLKTLNSDIVRLQTSDVYTLDNAAKDRVTRTPPAPLGVYNATQKWFFRDSNWSPDFSLSSRQAIEMYGEENQGEPVTIAGVIGITPTYVTRLLEIVGAIEVYGQTFDAQNFTDKLEYQVEYGYAGQGIPEAQRKEVIADLVSEMKTRLYGLTLSRWLEVLEATEEAFRTKQLVLYSATQDTEELLSRVGWAGRVTPATVDVQMVVDANLASLKSDPSVQRVINYEIFQNISGEWIGRTTVRYEHTGTFDWKTTRYRTYTRLYVPSGSTFIRAEGTLLNDAVLSPSGAAGPVDVGSELGLTVFGAFTSVEPGNSRDLIFEYKLAPQVVEAIESGRYALTVLKQIGAAAHGLTLDLAFDKKVTNAVPAEEQDEWGDRVYRLNTALDQDREFAVQIAEN